MSVRHTISKIALATFGLALCATATQAQSDVKAEVNFLNGTKDYKATLKAEPTLSADRTLLLPDANGTLMLNANPGIGGTGMLYGVTGPQNTALVSTYLFNVQYAAGAGAATGALITSASTGAGAMGLSLVATAGADTSTALRLTASGGSANYALDVVSGGIRIQSTLPTTTTGSAGLVLEGGIVKTRTITTVEAGSVDNTTLRWDNTATKWVENTNVLATSAGDMTLNSATIKATTNQLVLGTTNTTTISATAPAASSVYTIPDVGTTASFVMTAGSQTIAGAKTLSSALTITPTSNQLVLGTTNTTTINATAPAASRTYTIPDAGANASFVMTEGTQTINGDKTLSGATSLTGVATAKAGVAIRFENAGGTAYTGFAAASGQSSNISYTLPATGPSASQVLRANATTPTNLEWATMTQVDTGTTTNSTLRWNGSKWAENTNVLATSAGDMTLNSATVKATTNQLILGTTNTTTINAAAPAASAVYTIPDVGTTASFVMTAGAQTIAGAKTLSSALTITPTTNQLVLGTTNTTTINAAAPAASATYTIPDVGTSASFVMTAGTQTIAGDKTLSGATSLTGVATAKAGVAIRFENAGGTAYTGFAAASGQSSNISYTLPATGPTASQVLRANATTPTNLEWATLTQVDTGTTTNSTLRWNGSKWTENTNVLATSAGDVTANTLSAKATTNQLVLGTTNTTTISAAAPAASSVYTIPDVGTTGSFVMTEGTQTVNGDKTFSGATAMSTTLAVTGTTTLKGKSVLEPNAPADINGGVSDTINVAATYVKQNVTTNGSGSTKNVSIEAGTTDGQLLFLRLNITNAGGTGKISIKNSNGTTIETVNFVDTKRFYQLMYSSADSQWMILSSQVIN